MQLTLEDIKKELKEYYGNQQIINAYEKNNGKIEELYDNATKITAVLSDTTKGSSVEMDKKIAGNIAEIIDLKNENRQIEDTNNLMLIEMKNKNLTIYSTILKMDNPYKSILYYKYIENMNLTQIANIINREYKWCCKLNGKALTQYLHLRNKKEK